MSTTRDHELPLTSLDDLHAADRRSAMQKVTVAWMFGAVWATTVAGAPFTRFASALGATEMHFGLLAAMPFIANVLSLPASLWIDSSGRRKTIFLIALLTQRFMWLGIAIVPIALVHSALRFGPQLALFCFLAMMAVTHICQAVGSPAWVSWMADLVPDAIRGRYFARRRQLGIVTSIPTAFLAGFLLDQLAPAGDVPQTLKWCAILFGVATLAGIVDIVAFFPVPDVRPRPPSKGAMWMTLLRPLRDRHFMWFCCYVAALTMAIAPMGQFTTLYLVEKLRISSTQVQLMLLVAPMVGQFLIVPMWGRMADRIGRKPMMAIATFGMVPVGLGWCVMNLGYAWLGYVLAVGGAMLWAAVEIANFNLVLEMSGSDDTGTAGRGSGYTSVNSVVLAIAGATGGIVAGALMTRFRDVEFTLGFDIPRPFGAYEILFACSAALRLVAGLVFLPKLHEPKARSTREAIEFMADNMYNNVVGVVFEPVKRFVTRRPDGER